MKLRYFFYFLCAALIFPPRVWAGGSGLNVVVVVNQNSTNSLQLGNDYCELRGVPPQNLLRMTNWTGGSISWSQAQFTNYLLNPLLAMIANRGLTNQAQLVLLSMDIPYRVTDSTGQNSTTSALFYGFKTNGAPVVGYASCSLPDNSSNSYAYAELPFSLAPPNTAVTDSLLAMMLTDTNLAGAEKILRQGVSGDRSYPTQKVYLEQTVDTTRNVRFLEADNAVFENQVVGNYAVSRTNSNITGFTNLLGFQTGMSNFALSTNGFMAGSVADNLTSFGGYILESSGQTPLLAFLEAGAVGSYGTVVEPCNYLQKFPDPVDYFYQTRGFSLVEAYYQSVQNPFQGLMVGEPLSAPFARPGSGAWTAPVSGAVLSGVAPLCLNFMSAVSNLPLSQVDLFVDGTFSQTMTNLPPVAGNSLSVTLNGDVINYPVPAHATLASLARGLAAAINLQATNTQVLAYPVGDRIELQSEAIYIPGGKVTLNASAGPGSASSLTTGLTAARPAFLDSIATGYHYVEVAEKSAPILGDWLQSTFIKTNGTMVTLGVTNNTAGTSLNTLVQNLFNLINSTPGLQTPDGVVASDFIGGSTLIQFFLNSRSPGCGAAQILVQLATSTNLVSLPTGPYPLADNLSDLLPRNHLYLSSGLNNLPVNFRLDTTQFSDGWHQLTAIAYEGTSVSTQTRIDDLVQVQNTSLNATLSALPAGSNTTLTQPLQFTVTANSSNIASIVLFGTGGPVGVVSNQASAAFTLTTTNLGLGLHPFYALVTDQAGNRYQTQVVTYRLVPINTNPAIPVINVLPAASPIVYGQPLASSTLSGGAASTDGNFTFTTPGLAPSAGVASVSVTFTPVDTNDYLVAQTNVNIIVQPAAPVITLLPAASPITNGQTLTSSTLSGGAASTAGSFVFTTPGFIPSPPTASVSVTFLPADMSDYLSAWTNIFLTVLVPPTITVPPTNLTVLQGSNAVFTVGASGTAPLNFQWSFNGTPLPGANGPTLELDNVQLANAGNYALAVSNSAGATNSLAATLTVLTMPPAVPTDTPLLPWWGLGVLALLLFCAGARAARLVRPSPAN